MAAAQPVLPYEIVVDICTKYGRDTFIPINKDTYFAIYNADEEKLKDTVLTLRVVRSIEVRMMVYGCLLPILLSVVVASGVVSIIMDSMMVIGIALTSCSAAIVASYITFRLFILSHMYVKRIRKEMRRLRSQSHPFTSFALLACMKGMSESEMLLVSGELHDLYKSSITERTHQDPPQPLRYH